jgi:uncharacterized membrane protein YccC
MSHLEQWVIAPSRRLSDRAGDLLGRLPEAMHALSPPLLFGLRLWGAVCLTFYVAFWLELDTPYWAATTAAIVCQPSLGASLRKASFRIIGTIIGAIAIVALTAFFPQSRVGFLLGLALWGATCGFVATILQNFAAYAAALAGYTAVIIASNELGATGGTSDQVLLLAINRASEICIGIVCAGVVLAGTDFGTARRRLSAQFASITGAVSNGFYSTFGLRGRQLAETRPVRRGLIRDTAALGPTIDEAIGESTELRYRSRALQSAVDGLFAALTGWRIVAYHLEQSPDTSRRETDDIVRRLPSALGSASGPPSIWAAEPIRLRQACRAAARELIALRCVSASQQLMADYSARALLGLTRAFDGLALLANPTSAIHKSHVARFRVPDWLPAIINAVRVLVTIVAVELFWIATAWPNGALAMVFAAIAVILLAPNVQAQAASQAFLIGSVLSTVLAAITAFAVLPMFVTFVGFSLALGAVLVPIGALSAQPWNKQVFTLATINFIPLIAPENVMVYNTHQFYNSAAAILVGLLFAVVAFQLIPNLSAEQRTHRLLTLTLRDLRRLILERKAIAEADWEDRIMGRLSVLPPQAELRQAAMLAAALSVGAEVIRLRRFADRSGLSREATAALDALAGGDSAAAIRLLSQFGRALAAVSDDEPGGTARLRARGSARALSEALFQFAPYFDAGATR